MLTDKLEAAARDVVQEKLSKDTGMIGSTSTGLADDKYIVNVEYSGSPLHSVSHGEETDYGVATIDFVFDNGVGVIFDKETARQFYEKRRNHPGQA